MLTITAIFLAINIFIIAPIFFIVLSWLFSDESFTFKESFLLCLKILAVSLFFQLTIIAVFYHAQPLAIFFIPILYFAALIIITRIIKSTFDTSYPKAIFIQVLNIIFSLIITFSFKTFICQAYKIPTGSNMPTIVTGDHLLANKYIYRFNPPERNDIIIFKFPKNEKIDYIKRVVAIPDDTVEIIDKKLFINQQPVEESYIINSDDHILSEEKSPRDNFGPVTVPPDSYFVLGDNRDNSFDSRFFGFIDKEKIKGKAEVIYFSYDTDLKSIRTERIGMTIK